MSYFYKIKHHEEEFHCHICGAPVDVGHTALMVECKIRDSEFPICSTECDKRDLREWQSENEPGWGSIDDYHCYAHQ